MMCIRYASILTDLILDVLAVASFVCVCASYIWELFSDSILLFHRNNVYMVVAVVVYGMGCTLEYILEKTQKMNKTKSVMEPENLFSMKIFCLRISLLFLLVPIDSVNILNDLKIAAAVTDTATATHQK